MTGSVRAVRSTLQSILICTAPLSIMPWNVLTKKFWYFFQICEFSCKNFCIMEDAEVLATFYSVRSKHFLTSRKSCSNLWQWATNGSKRISNWTRSLLTIQSTKLFWYWIYTKDQMHLGRIHGIIFKSVLYTELFYALLVNCILQEGNFIFYVACIMTALP